MNRPSTGLETNRLQADQARIFRLLDPGSTIGVTLTSAYQLVPEASTSAIIVHHPAAMYYMVKV